MSEPDAEVGSFSLPSCFKIFAYCPQGDEPVRYNSDGQELYRGWNLFKIARQAYRAYGWRVILFITLVDALCVTCIGSASNVTDKYLLKFYRQESGYEFTSCRPFLQTCLTSVEMRRSCS